jgi:serine/threonine protein kinase
MLMMEYAGTRLGGLIKRKLLDEEEVSKITYQILSGLKVIHDNGYIHRDLSTENILVNK